ncbi:MAG: hypothetical protein WBA99_20310 [Nodosilinea sp.]
MTITLLGDSLLDIGNLTNLLSPFGITPFPDLPFADPPYSDGKPSNDLVLGEAIVAQLGILPESLVLGARLPGSASTLNPLIENISYAIAGATSGLFGSVGNQSQTLPFGVQSQIALFAQNLTAAGIPEDPTERPDILLSIGSNDVFDVLVDINSFVAVLATPDQEDDRALKITLASQIVGNIETAVSSLEGLADDIVIIGPSRLGDSPFSIQTDAAVDARLPGDFAGQTRAFLTGVAAEINTRLFDLYNDPSDGHDLFDDITQVVGDSAARALNDLEDFSTRAASFGAALFAGTGFSPMFDNLTDELLGSDLFGQANDFLVGVLEGAQEYLENQQIGCDLVENVMVIDGIDVFEAGLQGWQQSVLAAGLTPITNISYLEYLTQATGLPDNLDSRSFAFADRSHPASNLNQFIAAQIAPQIQAEFPDFGLS